MHLLDVDSSIGEHYIVNNLPPNMEKRNRIRVRKERLDRLQKKKQIITFSNKKNIPIQKIMALRKSVGWNTRTTSVWQNLLKKSTYVATAWEGEKLVGFGRIVDDGVMCMFYDIVVHSNHHRKGIGKQLMNQMMSYVKKKNFTFIGLFVDKKNNPAIKLYEKVGFVSNSIGMELPKYMSYRTVVA